MILGLLESGHGQRSLDPDVGELVCDADQHGLVDPVKQVVINLGVFGHAAQELVDELTHTEAHRVAVGFVSLVRERDHGEWLTHRNKVD